MAQRDNNDGNGTAHNVLRIFQVLTLIPAWVLLAVVIDRYNKNDAKTPGSILFLFVVAILASVWAFCMLITYIRARNTALWMTFFDLIAMALLIAAVVVLSDIANSDCDADDRRMNPQYNPNNLDPNDKWWNTRRLFKRVDGPYTYRQDCGKIKAAWGLAIANIIFFLITAILAAIIYRKNKQPPVVREKVIVEQPAPVYTQPAVATPSPVFQEPYYGPPRRHSRGHRSQRSQRSHSRRNSYGGHHDHDGSYYEGGRRGSHGPDYYV